MKEITVGKIRRSLQRFKDFASDLGRSNMSTFDDRLKLLMSYCKTDTVFSIIHKQLINVPNVDFDAWYKEVLSTVGGMEGSGSLGFPTNLDERLSLMYRLLDKINEGEIDLLGFAHNFFYTGHSSIDSIINAFNEAVLEPLTRELSYRIEDLEEEMPEDNKVTYPLANIQIVHNATNVIQQSASGNNIHQNANLEGNGELIRLFDELRQELQKKITEKDKLADALQVVESSEELAQKGAIALPSVKTLLSSLGALGSIGSIVSAILAAVAAMG